MNKEATNIYDLKAQRDTLAADLTNAIRVMDVIAKQRDEYQVAADKLAVENKVLREDTASHKPKCKECATWVKQAADNAEWIEGVKRGKEICKQLAAVALTKEATNDTTNR